MTDAILLAARAFGMQKFHATRRIRSPRCSHQLKNHRRLLFLELVYGPDMGPCELDSYFKVG